MTSLNFIDINLLAIDLSSALIISIYSTRIAVLHPNMKTLELQIFLLLFTQRDFHQGWITKGVQPVLCGVGLHLETSTKTLQTWKETSLNFWNDLAAGALLSFSHI